MTDITKELAAADESLANDGHRATDVLRDLVAAIRAQKPVLYALPRALANTKADGLTVVREGHQHHRDGTYCAPLYAAPPAAARVTVMVENIGCCTLDVHNGVVRIPRDAFLSMADTLREQAPPAAVACEVCAGTGGVRSHMNGRDTTHPCPRGCAKPAAVVDGATLQRAFRDNFRLSDAHDGTTTEQWWSRLAAAVVTQAPPAAVPPETLCEACGQPTMHMGSTCYGCGQAAQGVNK